MTYKYIKIISMVVNAMKKIVKHNDKRERDWQDWGRGSFVLRN